MGPELREDVLYEECSTCHGDPIRMDGVCRDCQALGYVEHDQESHMVKANKVTRAYLLRNEKFILNTIEVGPETAAEIERTEYVEPSAAIEIPTNCGINLNWNALTFGDMYSNN